MKQPLSDAELKRIQEAVAEAERRTSGEIVPYVVEASGHYDGAVWKSAAISAVTALAVSMLVHQFYHGWGLDWLFTGWGTALLAVLAGTLGALATYFLPALQRKLTAAEILDRAVHQRAMQAFVEEEVFATRERTGILLFISLLEHRIEVLGDSGINHLVKDDDWADVVLTIRNGIRSGRFADGLIEAIGLCGNLLERSGVALRHDDQDELRNELRVRRGR